MTKMERRLTHNNVTVDTFYVPYVHAPLAALNEGLELWVAFRLPPVRRL